MKIPLERYVPSKSRSVDVPGVALGTCELVEYL